MSVRGIIAALFLLALANPAAAEGGKVFKDWLAVCDNARACAAFGSPPGIEGDIGYLKIARSGAPGAAPKVSVAHLVDAVTTTGAWSLMVDGKPVADLSSIKPTAGETYERATLSPAQGAALIAAIRNGGALAITSGGKAVATISLAGSAAALLWMDDQQKRVGTVTALARPGDKAASAVPPPPPAPLLVAGPSVSQAGLPKRTPRSVKARLKDFPDCSDPLPEADADGVIARLAPGVVLYGPVCDRAAYNELNVFFIGDEKGGALKPVRLPLPPGSREAAAEAVMNVDYDAKTRILTSFSKGRGLADCGDETQWVWDGKAFRLLRQALMPECRGIGLEDWPTVFVARLK